jgi:hypothetical protein
MQMQICMGNTDPASDTVGMNLIKNALFYSLTD